MPEIQFYESGGGRSYVTLEIQKIQKHKPDAARKILDDLELLEQKSFADMLKSRFITKIHGYKNLYELRTSWDGMEYRIFFGVFGSTYWMTNLFVKKSQTTPKNEIETAIRRLENITR